MSIGPYLGIEQGYIRCQMPPRALLLFKLEIRVIVMPFYSAVMALWTGFRGISKQDMNRVEGE